MEVLIDLGAKADMVVPPANTRRWMVVLALALSLHLRADDAEGIAFFEKEIRPLLVAHCYECHAGGEANGGLSVESRDAILRGGDSGPAAVANQPSQSLLIEAVRHSREELKMPPQNRLRDTDIASLEKWVQIGLPDPRSQTSHTAPMATGMSIAEGRLFWSFKPLTDPALPILSQQDANETPIDFFLAQKRQAKGLRPAPPTDRRTLLRRLSYDLVGLPPTPDEIQRFLGDESPDADSKLLDRLLADPSYGIRWGRHWLDVARYADSNGLDENLAFGSAWRYRDYVIDAFNTDKPFDQFTIEQLAGDLLPNANTQTRAATGFLVLGAKVLAEPDREKLTMDTIDEQLDTIGKAFWGMTLGCVRCHDHKFDPLKQTDYYGLAAIMKSTRTFGDTNTGAIKHWNEFSLATAEERESIKQVDAAIAQKKEAATSFKNAAMERIRTEARQHAAKYLSAAMKLSPEATLVEVKAIAEPLQLHPRILAHCRRHIEYHRDDPLFQPWYTLVATHNQDELHAQYQKLFHDVESALADARKANPATTTLADPKLEAARTALYDLSGFLAVPPKVEFAFDADTLAEFHRLSEEARVLESQSPDEPVAMGVQDQTILTSLPIHIRGNHLQLGSPVPRTFPAVMQGERETLQLPADQSGRRQLADWMTSPEHPLTARVIVNRLWRWHFGVGIVASVDNFGRLGDTPTHPELLDWLAMRMIESRWSIKDMHRMIVSSDAYKMATLHPDEATSRTIDPENHFLWKARLIRLEAEQLRDAILAVSGRLDDSIGGKTVPLRNKQFVFDHTSIDHTRYDSRRRAIYLPVIRNNVYPFFEQFDFPDPTMPTGSRNSTVVAPQSLLMMNSDLVMDSAEEVARDLLRRFSIDRDRVIHLYETTLSREATEREIDNAIAFIQSMRRRGDDADLHAWSLLSQSLLACNEFIFLR